MIKTYEKKPQVIVEVDGLPAVCKNMSCDYTYIQAVGSITSFSLDSVTNQLTIEGTELPTDLNKIQSIQFAKEKCIPVVPESGLVSTTLKCTLENTPTCGEHLPILVSVDGAIPVDSTV
jgi:hypothetical protein